MKDPESERAMKFLMILEGQTRYYWTEDEINLFYEGLERFGKDSKKLSEHIGTKSLDQVTAYCYT